MTRSNPAERYWPLVRSIARKVRASLPDHSDATLEDLEQHGHVGLLEAAERYDSTQGKFSTFAYLRIRGAIYNSLRGSDPRPERVVYRYRELARTQAMLEQLLGRTPTPAETAESLGITHGELADLIYAYHSGARPVSFDTPIASSESSVVTLADTLGSTVSDPASLYEQREAITDVRRRVANLDERTRRVIALHYGEGLSYREIGETLGLSHPRIQQIINAALERMRGDELNQQSEASS